MAKYAAQLKATSNEGKTVTTSITNINPEASAETILGFTQRLNALTVNTYDSTDYIVTTNIDTEEPPSGKTEPTLTVTNNEITLSWLNTSTSHPETRRATINYNGDGELYAYTDMEDILVGITNNNHGPTGTFVGVKFSWTDSQYKPASYPSGKKIYIHATSGENYAAKTIEFAIE